ncbi:DUF2663 family protein [Bacillus sp. FJAT-47783]|uniref:DUF2663 family protein n=1 Tax=Bacillus sp. FJAT-47783 TaxID=2922712 RepID=UPI001FADCCAA|nr:DUF2663 family protein [Bacillus sp. FJAT-47783]
MENQIKLLPFTDEPTKNMLQELVKRKHKYDTMKSKCFMWQMIAVSSCVFLFIYGYFFLFLPNNGHIGYMFQSFINNLFHLFFVLFIGSSYASVLFYKKKEEKKEKEFHDLRCEIIDKSTDLWNSDEAWKERDRVFTFMKNKYDINLYFESK